MQADTPRRIRVRALVTRAGALIVALDPQAAADLGNFGSRNGPTELERDMPVAALAPKLAALGHVVRVDEQTSGVQTIVRTPQGFVGGADPRREGVVLGD